MRRENRSGTIPIGFYGQKSIEMKRNRVEKAFKNPQKNQLKKVDICPAFLNVPLNNELTHDLTH